MEEKRRTEAVHNLILENRERLSVSGVEEVESFHEEEIVLHTGLGVLFIRGEGLHIQKLSVEVGEVVIEGNVFATEYLSASRNKSGSILSRMFR